MNYFNSVKKLLLASCVGAATIATAQTTMRPLSYGIIGTSTQTNWYKDYVGVRFQVTQPASIAGDKAYTTTNEGTGATGEWGAAPISFSDTVMLPPSADSAGCVASGYPTGYFNGKIALIWRGNCEFGYKALKAQEAGAVAVVIVNNVAGGPVGMAAGASGASVTVPVFMVSLDDGNAMKGQINAGNTVILNMLTQWSSGYGNDLGMVPSGYGISANFAMPLSQFTFNPSRVPYQNKHAAYVANFGTNTASNVSVEGSLSFTPGSDITVPLYKDTVTLSSFPQIDSVWAFFGKRYSTPLASVTSNGRFDLKYNIFSDSVDQFPGNNSVTYSYYLTDSLFSKSRYDFAKDAPVTTTYIQPSSATPFIYFSPYYISKGGSYMDRIKFSVVNNGVGLLPSESIFFYVFKWVDADADQFVQNSELELMGTGLKTFNGTTDSSFGVYTAELYDTLGVDLRSVRLDSNSWYYIGAELPDGYALGCDGQLNGFPRSMGFALDTVVDLYNPIWGGDRITQYDNWGSTVYPWSFDGSGSGSFDSVMLHTQKGLIPALPFYTTTHPVAVGSVKSIITSATLYPNPVSDVVSLKVDMEKPAKQLVYTVIDGTGRFVARETRSNLQNDVFTYNTSHLAAGNYYMLVTADGITATKKFVVVR